MPSSKADTVSSNGKKIEAPPEGKNSLPHEPRPRIKPPPPPKIKDPEEALSQWKELWTVHVGSTEGEGHTVGVGQIAPRGSMIVLASRGMPNEIDDDDGVHVVDGSTDVKAAHRTVRIIKSPHKPGHGATDAVGVALDGDFVVFGTYGGLVSRVRLDGVVDWVSEPLPDSTRPGLPTLADLNGDGRLDVLVPIIPMTTCATGTRCGPAWDPLAIALDGKTGKVLWRLDGGSELSTNEQTGTASSERLITYVGPGEAEVWSYGNPSEFPENFRAFLPAGGQRTGVVPSLPFAILPLSVYDSPGEADLADEFAIVTHDPSSRPGGLRTLGLLNMAVLKGDSPSHTVADWPLDAPTESFPSLADVDANGRWDVLVVSGGTLHAISTNFTGDAARTLARSDLAATGRLPLLDSPAAYSHRVEPRDESRWLRPSKAPNLDSFEKAPITLLASSTKLTPEPTVLEREPKTPIFAAQTECGGKKYATNEGSLVVEDGPGWKPITEAAWPVIALGCASDVLVTEVIDGARYSIREPWPVQRYALWMVALFSGVAALAIMYTSRKRARHPSTLPIGESDPDGRGALRSRTRRAIVPDGARTDPEDALESQQRLLTGLLNVLDNDDTRPPVTVALYGAWGTGKSSLMQMLRSELKATGRYIDVWFNAWRFQRESELAPALLQCIVDEVGQQSDWVTRVAVIWNRIRRATAAEILLVVGPTLVVSILFAVSMHAARHGGDSTTNRSATALSGVLFFVGAIHRVLLPLLNVFSLDPAKLLSSSDSKKRIQFVREFSREFEEISRKLPDGTRLIVFIDDLDRCPPDRIVNVLETLSMLADTGCGFFVLAIDPVTVRRAIELTYKDLLRVARRENPAEAAAFGSKYLEKMITLGVNVPVLPAADVSPDARLDEQPKAMNPLEWFWTRVMPGTPLIVTVALLALTAGFGYRRTDLVEAGLDLGSSWLSAPAPSASSSAAPPGAPTPRATPIAAEVPAPIAAPMVAPAPPSPPSPTPLKSRVQPPRAPVLDRAPPPPVVPGPPAEAPSVARHWSERVIFALAIVFGLPFLGIVLLVIGDLLRRRRIRIAGPMGTDSEAFAGAFTAMKRSFVDTPRNVVRFTNLARFLYSVVAERSGGHSDTTWTPSFFKLLEARWKGVDDNDPSCPEWLKHEMDQWLPSGSMAPPGAAATFAGSATTTSTTTGSVPPSSGQRNVALDA